MKTLKQVNAARKKVTSRLLTPGLTPDQLTILAGMLNALAWVAEVGDRSAIEKLLSAETFANPA